MGQEPIGQSSSSHDFDAFVREFQGSLFRFARNKVSTEDDAHDVVQESLSRLLRYRDHAPEAWPGLLYRIAYNVIADRGRKVGSQKGFVHVDIDDYHELIDSGEADPGRSLDVSRTLDEVQRAILKLPARCRDVYLLNRIEGMSYTEIATHCGISVKAVEKHISKALSLIRKQVEAKLPTMSQDT